MAGNGPPAASKSSLTQQRLILLLNGATLAGCAVFSYPGRDYVLIGLMLFLPLLDRGWKLPALPSRRGNLIALSGLALAIAGLVIWQPSSLPYAASTLFLAALPEEWFFRAYFMTRLGHGRSSNLIASLLFSLLHGLTRDWTAALLVFVPSLFYGWLYQRTRDLPLLVLIHALSNLVFALFLANRLATFLEHLR
jgi:membrane protease YdiL (CAAX protease family)